MLCVQIRIMCDSGNQTYAVVTPLRKAASYEPRIAILGIWGDTWQLVASTASTWQYVLVTGTLRGLRDAFWKFCHVKSALSTVVYPTVAVTRIPSLVLRIYVALRDNTAPKILIA